MENKTLSKDGLREYVEMAERYRKYLLSEVFVEFNLGLLSRAHGCVEDVKVSDYSDFWEISFRENKMPKRIRFAEDCINEKGERDTFFIGEGEEFSACTIKGLEDREIVLNTLGVIFLNGSLPNKRLCLRKSNSCAERAVSITRANVDGEVRTYYDPKYVKTSSLPKRVNHSS